MEFVICHNVNLTVKNILAVRSANSVQKALDLLEAGTLVYDQNVSLIHEWYLKLYRSDQCY